VGRLDRLLARHATAAAEVAHAAGRGDDRRGRRGWHRLLRVEAILRALIATAERAPGGAA